MFTLAPIRVVQS